MAQVSGSSITLFYPTRVLLCISKIVLMICYNACSTFHRSSSGCQNANGLLGMMPRHCSIHWVSGILMWSEVSFTVLSVQGVLCSSLFLLSPLSCPLLVLLIVIYKVGSPVFFQFSVTGWVWWAGLVAGL